MIGTLGAQILDQALEDAHVVEPFAPPLPIDEPHDALEPQIGEARHGRRAQMRIGDMRNDEAHSSGAPSRRTAKARRPRAIDRVEIRLLQRKDNPGSGREYPQYERVDWRKTEAPPVALGLPRHAADVAWRSRDCDQRRRRSPAGETRLRFRLAFSRRRRGGRRDLRRVRYTRTRGGGVHRTGRAARPAWALLQHPNVAA